MRREAVESGSLSCQSVYAGIIERAGDLGLHLLGMLMEGVEIFRRGWWYIIKKKDI